MVAGHGIAVAELTAVSIDRHDADHGTDLLLPVAEAGCRSVAAKDALQTIAGDLAVGGRWSQRALHGATVRTRKETVILRLSSSAGLVAPRRAG